MQCEQLRLTQKGKAVQCKQKAVDGFNLCRWHGWRYRYYIGFSWQENPGDHWTTKKKAIWPVLFPDLESAQAHINKVSIFKNMGFKRKLTACVERTKCAHPIDALRGVPENVK